MKLTGSHNTMSYLKPKYWWMKPINWLFAQCQDKPLKLQIKKCQAFDLRVFRDDDGSWRFAHGLVSYKGESLPSILSLLNIQYYYSAGSKLKVRLILEKGNVVDEAFFSEYLCPWAKERYPNIDFYGGYKKKGWVKLYDFGCDFAEFQFVSSMGADAKWYEKFIPRLYASRIKKNPKKFTNDGIYYFDFI